MNATTSPPNQRASDGPDDLDHLLGRFFRGEVPSPWPTLAAPVKSPISNSGSSSLSAGRMALAASVAALLAGGWFLSGRLPSDAPAGSLDNSSATVPHGLRIHGTQPANPQR